MTYVPPKDVFVALLYVALVANNRGAPYVTVAVRGSMVLGTSGMSCRAGLCVASNGFCSAQPHEDVLARICSELEEFLYLLAQRSVSHMFFVLENILVLRSAS